MGKPEVPISKIVFVDLYNQGKSGLEIARFFGIGRTTVSRYYKRYGLKPRTISEVRKNKFWGPTATQRKQLSKLGKSQTGAKNPTWKGGESITRGGYRLIRVSNGYIKEHRLVMEKELGRKLKRNEEVHHVNGNKLDNHPQNLILLSKSHHSRLHWADQNRRESQSKQLKEHYKNGKVLIWQRRKNQ